MNVSLDLIICTYNHAVLLDKVLKAIARQQVSAEVDWGVLVVNNNCTDETESVIVQHLKTGKIPLRTIKETRQGLNHARLCGVRNTSRSWLAFVDDDCILAVDWVQQAAAFASRHPGCSAFGGRVILDWETPPPPFVLQYGYCFAQQEHGKEAKTVACLVGAGMIMNRRALLATGWLDKQYLSDRIGKKLVSGGDVELALRLSAIADLWYNPRCQLQHIIPPHRTQFGYLWKINHGLGISQVLGDSLLYSGSYSSWLLTALQKVITATKEVGFDVVRSLFNRQSKQVTAMNASFLLGNWFGVARIVFMPSVRRREILGRAVKAETKLAIADIPLIPKRN